MSCYEITNSIYRKWSDPISETAIKYYYNDISTTNAVANAIRTTQTVIPKIKDVIYNDPATIVFWEDGTKTVVKCKNEKFDPEKGLAMAFSKKMLGNKGDYYNIFKKWLPEEKSRNDTIPIFNERRPKK